MEGILEKLNTVYERLQTLDIQPTKRNMEKLLQCLYDMQDIKTQLEVEKNAGTIEERTQADL